MSADINISQSIMMSMANSRVTLRDEPPRHGSQNEQEFPVLLATDQQQATSFLNQPSALQSKRETFGSFHEIFWFYDIGPGLVGGSRIGRWYTVEDTSTDLPVVGQHIPCYHSKYPHQRDSSECSGAVCLFVNWFNVELNMWCRRCRVLRCGYFRALFAQCDPSAEPLHHEFDDYHARLHTAIPAHLHPYPELQRVDERHRRIQDSLQQPSVSYPSALDQVDSSLLPSDQETNLSSQLAPDCDKTLLRSQPCRSNSSFSAAEQDSNITMGNDIILRTQSGALPNPVSYSAAAPRPLDIDSPWKTAILPIIRTPIQPARQSNIDGNVMPFGVSSPDSVPGIEFGGPRIQAPRRSAGDISNLGGFSLGTVWPSACFLPADPTTGMHSSSHVSAESTPMAEVHVQFSQPLLQRKTIIRYFCSGGMA